MTDPDDTPRRAPPGWAEETARLRERDAERAQQWDDLHALVRRFDVLVLDVKLMREHLIGKTDRIEAQVERGNSTLDYIAGRIDALLERQLQTEARVAANETRTTVLEETHAIPIARARRRKAKRQ